MKPRSRQWLPGEEIPEKHWMYRFAKRWWFNDFGAYKGLRETAKMKAGELQKSLQLGRCR